MSLRLRIHINTILTIIFILAIVSLVVVQHQGQLKVLRKEAIINDLTRELVTLSFATSDYLNFLNEPSQTQWQNQFSSMQTLSRQNDDIASALDPYFADIEEKFDLLDELTDPTGNAEVNTDRHDALPTASISLYLALQETANSLDVLRNTTQTELLRIQRNTMVGAIIYFVLLSAILIAVANSYIRFILRPLNQLMKGVTELENGNFDHQLPINRGNGSIQSSNELGQLAVAFNRMARQLQLTLADLQQELATNLAITERLRASEEKMRSIFRVAPTGIGMVIDRVIMEVNSRICEMTGYTKDELIGQNARLLYPTQEDYEFVGSEKYRQIAQSGTGEVETRWLKKDGDIIDILLASTPLDVDDLSKGVTFTALEITERKKAEAYIRNMNVVLEDIVQKRTEELQKANEELRSFAYSISHDLRAPLRAIDGFSRILIEEYAEQLTVDARRYLNLCRENAITMSKLIEGLLEYSRTGRQGIYLQMVEPETLVRTVLADLQHEYPDHPAQISVGRLPACLADAMLLKQVYQNLLQNAFKFTSKINPSQIEIGCDKINEQVIYYVKDNGVGFDMHYADRLFGVFQRLHGMTEYEGTGIGLAIVQRIIHRLGGEIWCEAELDHGATFFFTINPTQGSTNE
jgi:PAS domain S-box-containing protein